ncbi:MAG: hypothetical protein CVT59_11405 [Actinobacteria bacterium HGW-Actinobacteria-1]|jgi:hypothetical protein|nr:MAG: hypothetical protein CVT59_11405 [Actinobacteria bacterium HGW-Actinobacteria-1]
MHSVIESAAPTTSMQSLLTSLVRDAEITHGVASETAHGAATATRRALSGRVAARVLSPHDERRVRAYFSAVLRAHAFKKGRRADARYRAELQVASLIADLRSVGTPADRIRGEVAAFFGQAGLQMLDRGEVA